MDDEQAIRMIVNKVVHQLNSSREIETTGVDATIDGAIIDTGTFRSGRTIPCTLTLQDQTEISFIVKVELGP